MPPSLRSLLLALALAAILFGCAAWALPASPDPEDLVLDGLPVMVDESELHRAALTLIPPPQTLGDRAATIALKAVGVPYRWGGSSPASGFDCSGLVYWTYRTLGIELPHSSYALWDLGRRVPRSRMKRGDILFFYGLGHVGLYLGRGRMVHAPESGRRVEVVELDSSYYGRGLVAARRLARS
jgi:cell wall-associated NlpC family hydrolase